MSTNKCRKKKPINMIFASVNEELPMAQILRI